MKANFKLIKERQDNLTVKAPVDGLLTTLNAEFIGEMKNTGERIGQIDTQSGFRIRAQIDEYYLHRIEKGKYGSFPFAGKSYRLIVDRIFLEVREGSFDVDLLFVDDEPTGIRQGQTVHLKLELGDLAEATLLPRGGWYQKTGGHWVFLVDPSGDFATKRQIKVGRFNPEVYEILEGLQSGERVVTSSYDNFGEVDRLVLK